MAKSSAVDMAAIEQMFKQLTTKMDVTNSKIDSTKGQLSNEIKDTNTKLESKT